VTIERLVMSSEVGVVRARVSSPPGKRREGSRPCWVNTLGGLDIDDVQHWGVVSRHQ
jgi:hypothetical protein